MAEDDAEIALLHQMQNGQDGMAWNENGDGALEGEISSNTETSAEQVKEENIADDQVLRAVSPSSDLAASFDGVASPLHSPRAPPTALLAVSQNGSRSSSRASMPKQKTISGFVADDSSSDEESSTHTPHTTHLLPPSNHLAHQSSARSPLHASYSVQNDSAQQVAGGTSTEPEVMVNSGPALTGELLSQATSLSQTGIASTFLPKARLPHDRAGMLEDRIKEDPKGDMNAWLSLIAEHQKRNKLDDARAVYERFFKVFPCAADIWVAYAEMELANDNFYAAEQIFGKSLMSVPNVQLWSVYLNYIRRRNDLTNDASGTARMTISQAYDFTLANIGIDRDSGRIWQEYLQFLRSAPGQIGGNTWQDQQKMDQLRKAYQRAICVPMANVNAMWKEYDQFEMGLNKMTGRKFLQEKSPAYMTARSANTALDNVTRGLDLTNLPRLPPALGFDGDQEYVTQVELWHRWINWELEDPLVLKEEDMAAFKQRVLFVYKQCAMALRFWPEIWVEAAEWCFSNGLEDQANEFLTQGISANPESCLLAFKHADRLEQVLPVEEGDEGLASRGAAVREPYDRILDALYDLIKKLKIRETAELARIEETAVLGTAPNSVLDTIEEDDEDTSIEKTNRENAKTQQLKAVQQGFAIQTQLLSRTISFVWIALTRAMRRVQGKGKPGALVGGSRQILNDARTRGRITSDVYVASALIEHNVYKDPAGTKIFERGAKLFPEDETFILEYLKHLLSIGDTTNARAVFETSVNRLVQKPDKIAKAKPLYMFFHRYESEYGDLSQISKLERRMSDLFPEDPILIRFSSRYSADGFDPTAVRPIISPLTQMRPKALLVPTEQLNTVQTSPRPQFRAEPSPRPMPRPSASPRPAYVQTYISDKRSYGEDSDNEHNRPRKMARGESPLKGAAGRRLDQQKRLQHVPGTPLWQNNTPTAFVIPRDVTFLLSIIPRAETYSASRFNAEAMVRLLAETDIPDWGTYKASQASQAAVPSRLDNGMINHNLFM